MTLTVNILDTFEDVSQSEIEKHRNVATFDIETMVKIWLFSYVMSKNN